MRRLSATELAAVHLLLTHATEVETYLLTHLDGLRTAAHKETATRRARGLPPTGPYAQAHSMLLGLLPGLEEARTHLETMNGQSR